MAAELTISDLRDVVAALIEVTTPYQLGIQLGIDSAVLKTIEKNYPHDIARQKTEVIEYWLQNSRDASWSTLADAVERMGGHARLVETLREQVSEQNTSISVLLSPKFKSTKQSSQPSIRRSEPSRRRSRWRFVLFKCCCVLFKRRSPDADPIYNYSTQISWDTCAGRTVLLFGKLGHGKSTLGNKMLNSDGSFKINNEEFPLACRSLSVLKSASQCQNYHLTVFDHDGLFELTSSIYDASLERPRVLNLVIFVLKQGCGFEVEELDILSTVVREWKIRRISALVLTHCEHLSEEEREKVIEQFTKDYPLVAELMGKGILAVGFPDRSHIEPGSELSLRVEGDVRKLKQLVYLCDERVTVPQVTPRVPSPPLHGALGHS